MSSPDGVSMIPGSSLPTGVTQAMLDEHNLQALVELVYVRTGNEVMASALFNLERALTITNDALRALTVVQTMHNQIDAPSTKSLPFDFKRGDEEYTQTYTAAERSFTFANPADTDETMAIPYSILDGTPDATVGGFTYYTFRFPRGEMNEIIHFQTSPDASPPAEPTHMEIFGFNDAQPANTHSSDYPFPSGTGNVRTIHSNAVINDLDSYIRAYNIIASGYYGIPIIPEFKVTIPPGAISAGVPPTAVTSTITGPTGSAYTYFINSLQSAKNQLDDVISRLQAEVSGNPSDASSDLLTNLLAVRNGIPSNLADPNSYQEVYNWVIDKYDAYGSTGVGSAGAIQLKITGAITSAEALNDEQKEAVRRYLFVFEEYYKSAAAILNKITQIIEKMAQGIR